MHNKIFETHAHFDDEKFDMDREELLESIKNSNIETVINVGANIESSKASIRLAQKYTFIHAAVGVHPSDISELNVETFETLKTFAKENKVVAIGEIGLDYYWDKKDTIQQLQREWFVKQMELAVEMKLPVIIHSRDAASDTLEIVRNFKKQNLKGVIHCYSYSKEMAKEYVKLGYYLGIGGVVTFKNAKKLKEAVEEIPLESLLLETDSPYMAPEPYRGKRNSSLYLPYVVEKIAEIKKVTAEEVIDVTTENARRLFLEF